MSSIISIDEIIKQGSYNGKVFRVSADFKVSVLDWIQSLCEVGYRTAQTMYQRIVSGGDEGFKNNHLQFPGERQRKTPVADATTLLKIIQQLPRKYPGVAKFLDEQSSLTARYLGGDTSLKAEVQAIRNAQKNMPANHPMRVFGQAVENGEVGHMNDAMDIDEPGEGRAAIEWHETRADSKTATKFKSSEIKLNLPAADRATYVRANSEITRVSTGMLPCVLKRKLGVSQKKSARDFFTRPQLAQAIVTESVLANIAKKNSGNVEGFEKEYGQVCKSLHDIYKTCGLHDTILKGPPVLPALPSSAPPPPAIEATPTAGLGAINSAIDSINNSVSAVTGPSATNADSNTPKALIQPTINKFFKCSFTVNKE